MNALIVRERKARHRLLFEQMHAAADGRGVVTATDRSRELSKWYPSTSIARSAAALAEIEKRADERVSKVQ